jgi:hypothetical protein
MDFKAMVQDNYEEKNPYELYGVCDCEFHWWRSIYIQV